MPNRNDEGNMPILNNPPNQKKETKHKQKKEKYIYAMPQMKHEMENV